MSIKLLSLGGGTSLSRLAPYVRADSGNEIVKSADWDSAVPRVAKYSTA
jgi:hypothetical protein